MAFFLSVFLAVLVLLTSSSVHAQSDLVMGVSEGSSGGLDHAQASANTVF